MRGSWWRVLGILILLAIIQGLVQQVFTTLAAGVDAGVGFQTAAAAVVGSVFSIAGQVIVGPIAFCGVTLLYYDLRIRKEGFDLELLARDIGRGPGEGTGQ